MTRDATQVLTVGCVFGALVALLVQWAGWIG